MRAPRAPRRAARPLIGTLLGIVGVVLALAVASPASAHAGLTASDPAEGATVSADLQRVTLTFTEAPLAGLDAGLRIEVRDAAGADRSTGDVVVDGATMSKAVRLTTGPHTLLWRYVSPDGHPIDGQVAFTVTAATAPTASASASGAPGAATPTGSTPATPSATAVAAPSTTAGPFPWVIGVVVVLVLGGLVTALVVRRRRGA